MRRMLRALLALTIGLAPGLARADGVDQHHVTPTVRGLQLGAFAGFFGPSGTVGTNNAPYLGDLVSGNAPLGIEAGWRFDPVVYLGASGSWGPSGTSDKDSSCTPQVQCSQWVAQFLAEGRFYLGPEITPGMGWTSWLSVSAGWELFSIARSGDGVSGTTYLDGPVFPRLELGIGLRAGGFEIGPYLGFSIGWYIHETMNPAPTGLDSSVRGALHEWFGVGLRGSYLLGVSGGTPES